MPPDAGPFETVALADGSHAPLYVVRFDDAGASLSPRTAAAARAAAAGGAFTDVILMSHGWNNDFAAALGLYRRWAGGLAAALGAHPLGRPFAPLFLGVTWPSTAFLLPSEQGPDLAAGGGPDPAAVAEAGATREAIVDDLAAQVAPDARPRFYALLDGATMSPADAAALAALVEPLFAGGDAELGAPDAADRSPEAIVAAARAVAAAAAPPPAPVDLDDFGVVGGDAPAPAAAAPELAGGLGELDVRDVLRVLSVWRMKDRAGRVGAHGVGPLLRGLLEDTAALGTRVHLVGHSFGARVCLSAVAHPPEVDLPRPVATALLLQPAVNHLCFAADVDGRGTPGGYRGALARVARPIVSTFSARDVPLTRFFHLALVRPRDLGEAAIAAGGEPPNRYAALGGFGPRGVGAGARTTPIVDAGAPYDLVAPGLELLALDGARTIGGHGDVANPSTAWAQRALLVD